MIMRDIKFRALDNHNKVMKFYSLKDLADHDKFSYDTEYEAIQSGFDNWEWMQYTGLKDKNNKEIYEGDIVIVPDTESHSVDVGIGVNMKVAETEVNTLAVIKYLNGGFVFEVSEGGENWPKGITSFHATDYTMPFNLDNSDLEKEIEVIGNIFENTEILKNETSKSNF